MFFDKFGETWQLIKNSLAIARKNRSIFSPTLRQIIIGLLAYALIIIGLALTVIYPGAMLGLVGFALIIAGILFFFTFFPFIKFYYRAAQSWIVYKTFIGEHPGLKEGLNRARQNKGDIIVLAIVDILVANLASRLKGNRSKGGIAALIVNLVLSFIAKLIEEAWDLLGNYLVPAAIIPEQNVWDSIKEVPRLKDNVPAALVGVFGIDFVGNAVKGYLGILFFIFLILSGAIFYFTGLWIPAALLFIVYIGFSFTAGIFIDMAKTVYFTTFYVMLTRKNEIPVEYMGEIESYLKHQPITPGATGTIEQETVEDTEPMEDKIERLMPYIEKYRKGGYSDDKIRDFLVENDWPLDIVDKALAK